MVSAFSTHHQARRPRTRRLWCVRPSVLCVVMVLLAEAQVVSAQPVVTPGAPPANQPPRTSESLDLAAAMALARLHAPELQQAQTQIESVAEFRSLSERLVHRAPRATVTVGPRRLSGGGTLGWDATVGVLQEFSLGGFGRRLTEYADAITDHSSLNLSAVKRDASIRAGLFWADARLAREIVAIRQSALAGAEATARVAESRATVGKSSPAEAALARALLGAVQASVLSAEGEVTVADAQLRFVCGIGLHEPIQAVGNLDVPELPIDEDHVRKRALLESPELMALRAQARLLERNAQLGKAQGKSHIELGPSVTREGTGDWIVLANMSVQLPGVDPYGPDNAQRQLEANLARSRVALAEQTALKEVELALHEREHALKLRESLRKGSLEPSAAAVREYEVQYQVGRIDLTTLLAARRELLSAQERWAQAAADVIRAEIRLLRWVDHPLQVNQ